MSDLAAVLGQSQPRVSRHLKLLCDAGLLHRSREQHWIYYRLATTDESAAFIHALLESLDPADPAVALDRERTTAIRARRDAPEPASAASEPLDVREEGGELAAVLSAELGDAAIDSILYAGDAPAAIVEGLASRAHRAVALSGSRDELARARSRLQGAGLARSELRVGDPRSLPFAAGSFDVVIVDREDDPDGKALREAARVLKSGGRLVVVEDYERLEAAAAGANPLVLSRERLARAGLACTRLRPLDLDRARLLLAFAAPAAARNAAA